MAAVDVNQLITDTTANLRGNEALVNKAFQEILGRNADPSGLASYTWYLGHHTFSELENDLMKSAEYRDKHPNQPPGAPAAGTAKRVAAVNKTNLPLVAAMIGVPVVAAYLYTRQ